MTAKGRAAAAVRPATGGRMKSTVQLFNTALARLGGEQLDKRISPQETDTLGALCATLFEHVLDMALAAHTWTFALRRVALAVLADAPENAEYPLAYALPSDCVRPVRLDGCGGLNRSPAYAVEGDALRTREAAASLLYVQRVTDPRRWPPTFADALAWALAAELATAKSNDLRKQQFCAQNYEISLSTAIARDCAGQNPHSCVSPWKAARFGLQLPTSERR